MNVEFVRFKATDSVELQGWLSNMAGETATLHIHGMSGNGYENYFLDDLRQLYTERGISFFSIDTRGRGIVSSFWQGGEIDSWGEGTKLGGSCFERFDESVHDIKGAIDYLRALGKTTIILQGHSLGCTKVVNYLTTQKDTAVAKAILLAPTDMVGWAATDPHHEEYLAKAKQLLARGKGTELVGAQCWLDKTPLSAQTYPTICEAGSSADMYGAREGGALLGRVAIPMVIVYGDQDIGITKIDGTMDHYLERVSRIKNASTVVSVVPGASHSFKECESQLVQAVQSFLDITH